jgi:hypothetical protein
MPTYNKNFYFETSAVNYYANNFTTNDIIATKAFQAAKGNIYYISSIVLWEILLTKDDTLREKIIYCCQNLFHNELIKSPAEFIINFVKNGLPKIETPYNIHSGTELNATWKEICFDKRRSIQLDYEILKSRTDSIRKVSRDLYSIVNRITLDITVHDDVFHHQEIVRYYFTQIEGEYGPFDETSSKIIKIAILLVSIIFCCQVDLDPDPYISFWDKIGIKSPLDRALFLFKNYKNIVLVGPFYAMATMAYVQVSNGQKSNRGLILDCLHSVYLTYTDFFVTNDNHFESLSEHIDIHGEKILYLGKTKLLFHGVNIIPEDKL